MSDKASTELWTTGQAAEHLKDVGVTRRQVSRMVHAGELPAVRRDTGKWARIPAAAVRDYRERLLTQLSEPHPSKTSHSE